MIYANDAILSKLDTADFKALFGLCDRFQAPELVSLTSRSFQLRLSTGGWLSRGDAWEIFKTAARMDDPDLAKTALRTGGDKCPEYHDESLAYFDGIPARYCMALLKANLQRDYVSQADDFFYRPATFEEIAARFSLI